MRQAMIWAGLCLLIYGVLAAAMYVTQRRHMYFPDRSPISPAAAGLDRAEEVMIPAADGEQLQAWYAPGRSNKPTVIFFQGNAGHIAHRAERFAALAGEGFGVLFLSYRGYGGSTGAPSEAGLVHDAMAAHDWLSGRGIAASRIALIGESLGAAVAVQLAARRKVAALVLEAPFTSAVNVAREFYWWLPVGWLMKDRFESLALIPQVTAPVMVVHGDEDRIIRVAHGKRLFAAANQPKRLIIVPGGGHNGFSGLKIWDAEMVFILNAAGAGA